MSTPSIFTNILNSYLPEPQASLLNGMLFGVTLKTGKEFYLQLKMVGLLHLVVLSGANIALLSSSAALTTISLGRKISILMTIAFIFLFVLFVGPQAPVVRAAIMGSLALIAILYGRKNIAFYSLLIATFLIAIFKSDWIKSVSFQLSFGATLGLIIFGSRVKKSGFINYLQTQFRTSLAAQIFTAPLIFLYFHQISLFSPLTNVLVAWTVAPIMFFGFLTAGLGAIFHPLGIIPSYICYGLLTYLVWVIQLFSQVPYGYVDLK